MVGAGFVVVTELALAACSMPVRFLVPSSSSSGGLALVAPAAAGAQKDFEVTWPSAGTSDAIIRSTGDATPWDDVDTSDAHTVQQDCDVIDATGLSMPTANCLRVWHPAGRAPTVWMTVANRWSLPSAGNSLYWRFYVRNGVPDSEGNLSEVNHHPMECNAPASAQFIDGGWELKFGSNNDGTMLLLLGLNGITSPNDQWYPDSGSARATLNKNTTYRIELKWTRNSVDHWTPVMRIYVGTSTTAIYDETSIRNSDRSVLLSSAPNLAMTLSDQQMILARVGCNGGWVSTNINYHYVAKYAVGHTDWIGA